MLRVLVFVLVPAALLVAGIVYVAMNPERFLGVDGEQLGSSLARETPESDGGECAREKGRRWECRIDTDPGGDGAHAYELTTEGDGCWDAERASGSGEELSSCVDLWDYVWPAQVG